MNLRSSLVFLTVLVLFSGLSAAAPILDSWHEADRDRNGRVSENDLGAYPDYWSASTDIYSSYDDRLRYDYNCDKEYDSEDRSRLENYLDEPEKYSISTCDYDHDGIYYPEEFNSSETYPETGLVNGAVNYEILTGPSYLVQPQETFSVEFAVERVESPNQNQQVSAVAGIVPESSFGSSLENFDSGKEIADFERRLKPDDRRLFGKTRVSAQDLGSGIHYLVMGQETDNNGIEVIAARKFRVSEIGLGRCRYVSSSETGENPGVKLHVYHPSSSSSRAVLYAYAKDNESEEKSYFVERAHQIETSSGMREITSNSWEMESDLGGRKEVIVEVDTPGTVLRKSCGFHTFSGDQGETDIPEADFEYAPETPEVGEEIHFDSTSYGKTPDPIKRYQWDLDGDGEFTTEEGSESSTTWRYETPGRKTVTLKVTTEHGDSDMVRKIISLRESAVERSRNPDNLIQRCRWNRETLNSPSRVVLGDSSYNSLKVVWKSGGRTIATEYGRPGSELSTVPDTGGFSTGEHDLKVVVRTDNRTGDSDRQLAEKDCGRFKVREDGTPGDGSAALRISKDEVRQGSNLILSVNVENSGHILRIKDSSGETVRRYRANQNGRFNFEVPEDAETGKYTAALKRDRRGNPLGSVLDLITGNVARETFTVVKNQVAWKQNCQENGYTTEGIQGQISCIQEDIIPRCFENPVSENCQRIGQSLCQDLLDYNYDREALVCTPGR